MRSPLQFWNFRAQNYDEMIGPLYEEAYRLTAEHSLKYLFHTDKVLDFACGTGIVTLQMAPHVSQVRAIDISDRMAALCKEKAAAQGLTNVEVTQTDLFDPSLEPESFDAVTAFNVLCYVDNFEEVMARIQALLKPGGRFLSATDCLGEGITAAGMKKFIKSRTGAMPYVAFFSQKKLAGMIARSGFRILEQENLFPAPPNLFVAAER